MTEEADKRQQVLGAAVAIGAALTVVYMVRAHPEGLHAPAFVAYVAAGAFGLAGVTLILQRLGFVRAQIVPAFLAAACLACISGWVALGGGPRACSVSAGVKFLSGATACRTVFGAGALLTALISLLMLRQLFKR